MLQHLPNKAVPSIYILCAPLEVAPDLHSQDLVHSCGVFARLSMFMFGIIPLPQLHP